MKEFLLKDNEIMIFTDFNNTLVDFENEYNSDSEMFDFDNPFAVRTVKGRLTKALRDFERETGLVPVICVVTNASLHLLDANGSYGISEDLHMTFFDHKNMSPETIASVYSGTCEKYFKYLIYEENDVFFKINPLANTTNKMFEVYPFSEEAKKIRYAPIFKKRESVERMLTLIDPDKTRMKRVIFAGDSIKNDYPMKLAQTSEGVCKIFIRPGNIQKMKPSVMSEFCKAKGIEFTSVNPKNGKKIKVFDENSVKFLSEEEKRELYNYNDGDYVILTQKNSRGFIEGIYKSIEILKQRGDTFQQKEQ